MGTSGDLGNARSMRPMRAYHGCPDIHEGGSVDGSSRRICGRAGASRGSGPRTDHSKTRLQPLAGTAGGFGHSLVYRHGLRLQRLLAAAVQGIAGNGPQLLQPYPCRGTVHHGVQLACGRSWLDLYALLRLARMLGGDLGRLVGKGRAAQGRLRFRLLLVRRHSGCSAWRDDAPALADVGRGRCHRRRWSWSRLHLAGLDIDQMVSGPARHGNRHGHHGLRRRCNDRRTACQSAHEHLQDGYFSRCLANVRRHGIDLFRLHDGGCLRLPHSTGGLASGRLDGPGGQKCHDHQSSRSSA